MIEKFNFSDVKKFEIFIFYFFYLFISLLDLFNKIYLYFSFLKINRLNLKMTQEDKNLYTSKQ